MKSSKNEEETQVSPNISPQKVRSVFGLNASDGNNLDGLVKIKSYDNQVTDVLPML